MKSSSFVRGAGNHIPNRSDEQTILQVDCPAPPCCSCWGFRTGVPTPPAIEEHELSNTPRGTAFGQQQGRIEEPMHQADIHMLAGRSSSRISLEDMWQAMQTVQLALTEIRKDVTSLQTVQVTSSNHLKFLTDNMNALRASTVNEQLTLLDSRQQALEKQQESATAQHKKLKIDAESFEANVTSKLAELQTRMLAEFDESSRGLCSETSTAVSERLQSLEENILVMKGKHIALGHKVSLLTDLVPKEFQTTLRDESDANKLLDSDPVGRGVHSPSQLHDSLLPLEAYNPSSWNSPDSDPTSEGGFLSWLPAMWTQSSSHDSTDVSGIAWKCT